MKNDKTQNSGLDITPPKKTCTDRRCPFHGDIRIHGRMLTGEVISDKAQKTVTIKRELRKFVPKYERYAVKTSKIKAHSPECIGARKGDIVKIAETKPMSKTKYFVVVEKIVKQ
jgi:small subunit ribosomal protein S17